MMGKDIKGEVTSELNRLKAGDKQAYDALYKLVYDNLREIARVHVSRENANLTLDKTDLVHESFLKLVNSPTIDFRDRRHFYSIASRAMRQILVDHARKKKYERHGGKLKREEYNDEVMVVNQQAEEMIRLDYSLEKLAGYDSHLAEVVHLHFFAGLDFNIIAEIMNVSRSTVYRDWVRARSWLYEKMK